MSRFNTSRASENHLFIVTSVIPAALFVATLLAAFHVSKIDNAGSQAVEAGYSVLADRAA